MKIKHSILIIPVLIIGGFVRTLFQDFGSISARNIQIKNGIFVDKREAPLDGSILVNIEDAEFMLRHFLELIDYESEWKNLPFKNLNLLDLDVLVEEFQGFSVRANIENGKLTKKSSMYYDLRSNRKEIFGYPIKKDAYYYLGYLYQNRIKLAEAIFIDNQLHGDAFIYNVLDKKMTTKLVQVNFENNVPKTVTRFHRNGNVKRINNYEFFIKEGAQQEFKSNGALSFEVYYEGGKPTWQKSYYWQKDALREHITLDSNNTRVEKHYFPNGHLAKEFNGNWVEWYSNGEIKSFRSKDTTYYGKPIGKIETFHNNGQLHEVYHYNNAGVLDGPYEIYYTSGKIWERGPTKKEEAMVS